MEFRNFPCRSAIGMAALVAVLVSSAGATAEDAKKYPDWEGMWNRGSPVGAWDPTQAAAASGSRPR